jgi:hypothetical protein
MTIERCSTLYSRLSLLAVLLLSSSLAGSAAATPIGSGSGGVNLSVAAGLVSPVATITFNEVALADGTALVAQYAAFNVGFSGPVVYCTSCDFNQFNTNDGPMAANTFSPFPTPYPFPFSVLFPTPVSAAAFAVAAGGGFTLTAKLGGSTVGSLTGTNVVLNSPPGTHHNFYGFHSLVFDEIEITSIAGNGFFEFDNLMVGASVPEPASAVLVVAGLLAMLAAAKPTS